MIIRWYLNPKPLPIENRKASIFIYVCAVRLLPIIIPGGGFYLYNWARFEAREGYSYMEVNIARRDLQ